MGTMAPPVQLGVWEQLAETAGAPVDIVKLLSLLLLSSPLALPLPHFSPRFVHIYSIFTSVIFCTCVLDLKYGLLQLVGASVVTWVLVQQGQGLAKEAKGAKQSTGRGRRMPWVVFFLTMGHLTVNHCRRIFSNVPYDVVEVTGAHMVLVMKLSSFAWSVYDGQRPVEELDSYQKATRIEKVPGLLEFLGYCLFFPSLLVGPAFSFSDYRAYTSKTLFATGASAGKVPAGRFKAAGKRLAAGLVFTALNALYSTTWSYETMLVDGFLEKGPIARYVHMMLAGFTSRTKYYIVWCFAEAAFALSGAGYNPANGSWDGGRNIEVTSIELAQNYKGVFDNWNMKTNIWLREAVYKRVARPGKKPGFKSTMATFGTSAFWHGPRVAYFLAFFMGGFLQSLGRHIRTTIRPFFLPPGALSAPRGSPPPPRTAAKTLYDALCWIGTQSTLNYIVIPFMLLELPAVFEAYKRMGYFGHFATFVPLTFFWVGGGGVLKGMLKKQEKAGTNDLKKYEKAVDEKLGQNGVKGVNGMAPQLDNLDKM